jgi:hypothetical protein
MEGGGGRWREMEKDGGCAWYSSLCCEWSAPPIKPRPNMGFTSSLNDLDEKGTEVIHLGILKVIHLGILERTGHYRGG